MRDIVAPRDVPHRFAVVAAAYASGLGQLMDLRLDALTVRRYPRIPVFHGVDMHLISAPEKPIFFNATILVHNS